MGNSINDILSTETIIHKPSEVSVSWKKGGSVLQIIGLAEDDDAVKIEPSVDNVTLTQGLYGVSVFNINVNSNATLTIKTLQSHSDSRAFTRWHDEVLSGSPKVADFTITGADFRDLALRCLPVKKAIFQRVSSSEFVLEWMFLCAETKINQPL